MLKIRIIHFAFEFVFVELCSIVFGAGLGFVQGILAFSRQKTEVMLGLSGWAALTGGAVGGLLIPILYFFLIRNSLTLMASIEMSALVVFVGMLSAYGLGYFFDAGWLSWVVTTLAAIILTVIYCKYNFRILSE